MRKFFKILILICIILVSFIVGVQVGIYQTTSKFVKTLGLEKDEVKDVIRAIEKTESFSKILNEAINE